jgi:hypothetical protein
MFTRSASDLGGVPRDLAASGRALGAAVDRLACQLERKSLQRMTRQSRAGLRRRRLPPPQTGRPTSHLRLLPRRPHGLFALRTVLDRRPLEERRRCGQPADVCAVRSRVQRATDAIRARLLALRRRLLRIRQCIRGTWR